MNSWWSGLRIGVRMGRRDALRHKGRSLLVMLIVALPVLVASAATTFVQTSNPSPAEQARRQLGNAAAMVSAGTDVVRFVMGPDYTPKPAKTVAGQKVRGVWTTEQLEQLTGAIALPIMSTSANFVVDGRRHRLGLASFDAANAVFRGNVDLVRGKFPTRPDEIAISQATLAGGVPESAEFVVALPDGTTRQVHVVGVTTNSSSPLLAAPDFFSDPAGAASGQNTAPPGTERQFLLLRDKPFGLEEVRQLGEYGLSVNSREFVLHPQLQGQLYGASPSHAELAAILVLAGLGVAMAVEVALLAGPAFAVGAARARRSLALAASNGATSSQLRGVVVSQAIVLGWLPAWVCSILGILVGYLGYRINAFRHPGEPVLELKVRWTLLAFTVACAMLASLLAAVMPARKVGSLAVVQILRGRIPQPRVDRRVPVAGTVIFLVAASVVVASSIRLVRATGTDTTAIVGLLAGTVFMLVSLLTLVPAALVMAARGFDAAGVPMRMATRDASRQRSRSVPAVASILAAVAVLTILAIGIDSQTAMAQRDYRPRLPMGWSTISAPTPADVPWIRSFVSTEAPGSSTGLIYGIFDMGRGPTETRVTVALDNCVPAANCLAGEQPVMAIDDAFVVELPMGRQQRQVLLDGGILTSQTAAEGSASAPGQKSVTMTVIERSRQSGQAATTTRTVRLPSYPAHDAEVAGATTLITASTARKLGLPMEAVEVVTPTSLSDAAQQRLSGQLEYLAVYVERGYQDTNRWFKLVLYLAAGLILLVAALGSTMLSLTEQRADLATVQAIGGARGFARRVAGAQALFIAATGSVLGWLAGLLPGVMIARVLMDREHLDVAVPWPELGLVVVVVPLVAAAAAWLMAGRPAELTRRQA